MNIIKKTGFALMGLAGALSLSMCTSAPAKKSETASVKKPNILIIQPDQHRGDMLGAAGNKQAITPNLDALAARGVRFSKAVSASPVCSPFRGTMQTGLYIHEHGVVENGKTIKPEAKGIAEFLVENGYDTGYIGKWHLQGFKPKDGVGGYIEEHLRKGWQEWNGYEKSHEYFNVWRYNENKEKEAVEGYNWEPTWHSDMALDFIKRKTEEDKPWAYYISYGPPHEPKQCPDKYKNMFDPETFELSPYAEQYLTAEEKEELRGILQIYYGQVASIDEEVGRVLQGLKDMGVEDNTLVVYVSDHGDVLGDHHKEIVAKYLETNRDISNTIRTKGKPFATAFRIPLIIAGPMVKEQGATYDALVNSVDLVPTILDAAGIEVPEYMKGHSMAGWLRDGKGVDQEYVYLGVHANHNAWRAVWDGRYFMSTLDYKSIYDHQEDPYELVNHYDDPAFTEKKKELKAQLIKFAEETKDPVLPRLDDEIVIAEL